MSADTQSDVERGEVVGAACPPRATVMRSSTSPSNGLAAPVRRLAADLLVIEAGDAPRSRDVVAAAASAAVPHQHRDQVVEPRRRDELAVDARAARGARSCVMTSHADDVVGSDVELLREEPGERAVLGSAEAPHRHQVLLPVEHDAALVHVAVEVDRELRHAEASADRRSTSRTSPRTQRRRGPTGRGRGRATS